MANPMGPSRKLQRKQQSQEQEQGQGQTNTHQVCVIPESLQRKAEYYHRRRRLNFFSP